ncbi:ER membrane complex subunit 3 [Allomyces arbusculus]|nr:ER membrane complex subunit 3 [Allomyces arbusculus]
MAFYDGSKAVIVLDPAIRNWVLLPLMAIMLLVGLVRHYVTLLLASPPGTAKVDYRDTRQTQALMRSVNLRRHARHLPPDAVRARRSYFMDAFKAGKYLKATPKPVANDDGPAPPDMAGMEMAMDGMKKNMAMMVPQALIMSFLSAFFSGFLLIQLPFPLTVRFKSMLQSGILTPDLDATWVSSLSMYFISFLGMNPVFGLILGQGNAADNSRDMAAMNPLAASASASATGATDIPMPEIPQQGMPMLPGMGGADKGLEKAFMSETEYLQLLDVDQVPWIGEGIEDRVTALLTARVQRR